MNKLILLSSLLIGLAACERKTHDPTYHDPVVTSGAVDAEHAEAMRYRSDSNRFDFTSAKSCIAGCERYNKINADVDAVPTTPSELRQGDNPTDYSPAYTFKLNPNVPAAE